MGPTFLSVERSRAAQGTLTSIRAPECVDVVDPETIVDLSATRISEMNCAELVRLIETAQLPFLSAETGAHLAFHDRQTLERLANLARRCCLNRTAHPGTPVGSCH
jgi:hypothetical protein